MAMVRRLRRDCPRLSDERPGGAGLCRFPCHRLSAAERRVAKMAGAAAGQRYRSLLSDCCALAHSGRHSEPRLFLVLFHNLFDMFLYIFYLYHMQKHIYILIFLMLDEIHQYHKINQ